MNIAIISARDGSKRIPRKNIRDFYGKPMIAWTIEAARASGCFEHIIVSTEDEEIAQITRNFGAEVPFMRPMELADDHTGTGAVSLHALNWVMKHWQRPEAVCTLYATAPFLTSELIRQGQDMLKTSGAQIIFTATSFPFPIQRAIKFLPNGCVAMFQPEHAMTRSQDLEPAYHDAGQMYWETPDALLNHPSAFSEHAQPLALPRYLVQGIDTEEDWKRAEFMFTAIQSSTKSSNQ
jgi:N-acylneuraminate cytidylyltransferase